MDRNRIHLEMATLRFDGFRQYGTTTVAAPCAILRQLASEPFFCSPTRGISSLLRAVDRPSYDGEWRGDKKHGKGTEHFPDGRVYVGNFKNDVCTGIGCLTFPNGDTYRGLFNADGVPHDPKGEYSFANGDMLSGAWVEGKRHGTFSVSFASSSQHSYQAIFVNDQSMGITCLN